jgi:hypothetical protein
MKDNIINFEQQCEQSKEGLHSLQKEYMQPTMSEEQLSRLKMKMEEAKCENRKESRIARITRSAATAAALVIAFITLPNLSPTIAYAMGQMPILGQFVKVVTFRNYEYEDEQHKAEVVIPEIVIDDQIPVEQLQSVLENTTNEMNAEIQKISKELLVEFVNHIRDELGYKELIVKSEVVTTTQDYFTLKLSCYQSEASGYEWDYFYTIDLTSGKKLELKDIFVDGVDYITPISENIKEQMRSQMEKDENISYWLDDEMEESNFNEITEETNFYINQNNDVVICFNEGDVAPMYMGIIEFEIPAEVLKAIRK